MTFSDKAAAAFFVACLSTLPSFAAPTGMASEAARPITLPEKIGKPGAQGTVPLSEAPPVNATVAQIMANPRDYVGRNVTVVSEVEEIFTPWSFKLDENPSLAGGIDSDMLVVAVKPLTTMGFESSWLHKKAEVTGTIRFLQSEDIRRMYGRGVDDKIFRRYEGKATLIAQSIAKAP